MAAVTLPMKPKQLTVIIPTFNRANALRKALDSLVQQTCSDFAVLVCDDGSTDNTSEVVDSYSTCLDISYFLLPHSGGPAMPRNFGAHQAKTMWLSFLDSDDFYYPGRIEQILRNLEYCDILYHRLDHWVLAVNHGRDYCDTGKSVGHAFAADQVKHLISANPVPLSSVVIKRDVFLQYGGFDSRFNSLEDYELWFRLCLGGKSFYFLDKCLGVYSTGTDNISKVSREQFSRLQSLFSHLLGIIPYPLLNYAVSCFAYQLGCYSLRLCTGEEALYFSAVNIMVDPCRWIKTRLRLLRRPLNFNFL
jgi:glycosyltransferase involved in cell wall biosynthesis